jgi:hypothetical protein
VVTSLPDASQVPLSRGQWERWFEDAVALVLSKLAPGAAGMFYQTDVRRRVGGWVDKAALCQRGAAAAGVPLVFHKIVCRAPPGSARRGLAGYAHLLCFGHGIHEDAARPTPDVLPAAGPTTWTRGMGLDACAFACRWIATHTDTRTIIDPFCGHGTALAVANALGLDALGVEIGKERARLARKLQVVATPGGLRLVARPRARARPAGCSVGSRLGVRAR